MELTFLSFSIEFVLLKALENGADIVDVIFHDSRADQNSIYVDIYTVNQVYENLIDKILEYRENIGQAIWYYQVLIVPPSSVKGSFHLSPSLIQISL